jgi:tetratricopeptide (TPR) repeat protein
VKNSENQIIQDRIDAYRADKLSDEEIDMLWVDLIEYPDHMDYLINSVNLEAISAEYEQESEQVAELKQLKIVKKPVLFQLSQNWGRIAAVFLVGFGLLSMVYMFGNEYVSEPGPISNIELDSYRSSNIPTVVFEYEIQRAINLASLEQFDEALQMLQEMEHADLSKDQQVSLQVNRGSILYNKGDYRSARDVFNETLDNFDDLHILTEEQIQWYLGNTYLQLGEEELARIHIQKTYDLNGAYRRLAERFLE